jgi:hypothetical protein
MFVLVFAIEIQQAITNRGNMEFIDAIIGLWGFIALFLVYIAVAVFLILMKTLFRKIRKKDDVDI